jgi:hypothetical protein
MRVSAAASRYIQGPGVLDQLGKSCLELGRRAVVIMVSLSVRRLSRALTGSQLEVAIRASAERLNSR